MVAFGADLPLSFSRVRRGVGIWESVCGSFRERLLITMAIQALVDGRRRLRRTFVMTLRAGHSGVAMNIDEQSTTGQKCRI